MIAKRSIIKIIILFLVTSLAFVNALSNPFHSSQQERFSSSKDGLNPFVFNLALKAHNSAIAQGVNVRKNILTIVDYSLPSSKPRLFVVDLDKNTMLLESLVAHGSGSGGYLPNVFSDKGGTHASSIGLFLTENPYFGKHGYSLRVKGLEKGFNGNAIKRAIVFHKAKYINKEIAKTHGRIGRSHGCFAVDEKTASPLINTIKNGSLVFAYYPSDKWLRESAFLN